MHLGHHGRAMRHVRRQKAIAVIGPVAEVEAEIAALHTNF